MRPPRAQGNRTTPSYVAFTDTERLIGDAAKNQVAMNPLNTVFDAKRLIGRKFSDPTIQHDMTHGPFTVVAGPGDKPLIHGAAAGGGGERGASRARAQEAAAPTPTPPPPRSQCTTRARTRRLRQRRSAPWCW